MLSVRIFISFGKNGSEDLVENKPNFVGTLYVFENEKMSVSSCDSGFVEENAFIFPSIVIVIHGSERLPKNRRRNDKVHDKVLFTFYVARSVRLS